MLHGCVNWVSLVTIVGKIVVNRLRVSSRHSQSIDIRAQRARVKNIRCSSCVSSEIVVSQSRGADSLLKTIFPIENYRCLGCYKRFWGYAGILRNKARSLFWVTTAAFLIFLGIKSDIIFQIKHKVMPFQTITQAQFDVDTLQIKTNDSQLANNTKLDNAITLEQSVIERAALEQTASLAQRQQLDKLNSSNTLVASKEKTAGKSAVTKNTATKSTLISSESSVVKGHINRPNVIETPQFSTTILEWAQAWSNRDVSRYVDFYSNNYSPQPSMSHIDWLKDRQVKIEGKAFISVTVSNIKQKIINAGQQAEVTFQQVYLSNSVNDQLTKRLIFAKEKGVWKIIKEEAIAI